MGEDYCSLHLRTPTGDPEEIARRILQIVNECYPEDLFERVDRWQDADYSVAFAVLPGWSPVYPAQHEEEYWDRAEMDRIALSLSRLGPLVRVDVSDDTIVHFNLYQDGCHIDQAGNRKFGFDTEWTEEEQKSYMGNPRVWKNLVLPSFKVEDFLARIGPFSRQYGKPYDNMKAVEMLGGNPRLFRTGFFTYYDGDAMPLPDHLAKEIKEGLKLQEVHFFRDRNKMTDIEELSPI